MMVWKRRTPRRRAAGAWRSADDDQRCCLVLLRGPPGTSPEPSTDFSVTDGLRWNR